MVRVLWWLGISNIVFSVRSAWHGASASKNNGATLNGMMAGAISIKTLCYGRQWRRNQIRREVRAANIMGTQHGGEKEK